MTYIPVESRKVFLNSISTILEVLNNTSDGPYIKGEYFGYVLNRLIKKFLGDTSYNSQSFNSNSFNVDKLKSLTNATDFLAVSLSQSIPIEEANKLSFIVFSLINQMLSEIELDSNNYFGFQAYMEGILDVVKNNIVPNNTGTRSDTVVAYRRFLVVKGVLNNVSAQLFDKLNTNWLLEKKKQNGDV